MTPLNPKYRAILWVNVLILAGGVGGMVYYKWHSILYAAGAGLGVGVVEYIFMRWSLGKKQEKEQERDK